jgi:hypothetical protein
LTAIQQKLLLDADERGFSRIKPSVQVAVFLIRLYPRLSDVISVQIQPLSLCHRTKQNRTGKGAAFFLEQDYS